MEEKITGVFLEIAESHISCHISLFSDELKVCIRRHLQDICHGKSLASQGLNTQNYTNTLKAFHNRYKNKKDKQRKGMMGELLSHVIIFEFLTSFEVVSPFFNMEEKSQRKGFDLILVSKEDEEVWITEVKSGELAQKKSSDAAIRNFLGVAKADLNKRLNENEETFWLNAINTANNAISGTKDYKDSIIKILDLEGALASSGGADSSDNNVILISVLFHNVSELFSLSVPKDVSLSINKEGIFKKVITFSIQKETYTAIEDFLFMEELRSV